MMALSDHRYRPSSFRWMILFIVSLLLFSLFVLPRPVNGNESVDDISSVAVPLQAPLPSSSSLSSESGGLSMIDRLEKKIQAQSTDKKEEKMMITAAVAAEEEAEKANNNEKSAETVNNEPSSSTPSESNNANEKKPEEHRELGAGRAIVNAVWFIVIITVIPCLLCTCLLSCLCYMMEWIPNPFSGEYYSSGPYGGGGIWGTGTRTGTGWYGQGSTA